MLNITIEICFVNLLTASFFKNYANQVLNYHIPVADSGLLLTFTRYEISGLRCFMQ